MTDTASAEVQATQDAQARFDAARRRAGLLLGPALFILVLVLPFDNVSPEGHRLAAIMALVIVFWTTEALPLAVTALLGPALAVMLRVAPLRDVLSPFAHPLIFLFIGSFILAQALFVHRVNERIAYGVLSWRFVGARPTRILVAYGALAAFLSAWMSNTATTAMLVPIGVSLVVFMESEGRPPEALRHGAHADDRLRLLDGRNGDAGRHPAEHHRHRLHQRAGRRRDLLRRVDAAGRAGHRGVHGDRLLLPELGRGGPASRRFRERKPSSPSGSARSDPGSRASGTRSSRSP